MDALRADGAEFAVVGGFAAAPEIEAEPLVEEDIVVVGPPRYARRRLSRRDAEAATWIVQPQGSAFQAAVEAAWADLGITPARRLLLPTLEGLAGGGSRRRRSRLQPVRRRGGAPSWLAGAPAPPP